LGESL